MQVLGLDDPIAAESGWPRSLLVSVGASGRAACLFHGVTRPLVFVAVSMSRSSVEVKELHVDPGRRALVDPIQPLVSLESGRPFKNRSWLVLNGGSTSTLARRFGCEWQSLDH